MLESVNLAPVFDMTAWIVEKRKSIKDGVLYCRKHYGLDCDILVRTSEVSEEEWLRARKLGVSGTDIGAIARVNKYKSAISVFIEKTTDELLQVENDKMYFGKVLEAVVAKEFALRNPNFKVSKVNAVLRHKSCDFAIGNIDRLIRNEKGEKGILEVKTVSEYMKCYWTESEVPFDCMVQLQWYMFVTGVDYGYFVALIGGNQYLQKYVKRDEELIDMLREIAEDFWKNNVLKRETPFVDGSVATTEMLNAIYPSSKALELELGQSALDIISRRASLKENIKLLDIEVAECENKLKELLKDCEVGKVGDRKVIWKSYQKTTFNSKALKAEEPEVFNKYLKISSYRKFEVK